MQLFSCNHTDRQEANIHIDRQANKQTNRQTDRHTHKQTDTARNKYDNTSPALEDIQGGPRKAQGRVVSRTAGCLVFADVRCQFLHRLAAALRFVVRRAARLRAADQYIMRATCVVSSLRRWSYCGYSSPKRCRRPLDRRYTPASYLFTSPTSLP